MVSIDPRRFPLSQASPSHPSSFLWHDGIRQSKLRPPDLPGDILLRPRLQARLNERPFPITLLVAPAGFGKSTIAAAWASQHAPTAWFTADAGDLSLERFWAHTYLALSSVAPGLGDLVEASMQIPYRAPAAELGRILADELADYGELLHIVIDDIHLIPEGDVHEFLSGLLALAPPSLRLLLTARVAPPLPLNRLRLQGQINEIGSDDLLFNDDEVRAFLAQVRPGSCVDGADGTAARVQRRTGGWAAGLRLATLNRGVDLLEVGPEVDPSSLDYQLLDPLLEETMMGLQPGARQMLLRAALPERFTVSLIQAVSGGGASSQAAQDVLQFARNSGICRRSARFGGAWFEFHPLFRSLLLRHLEQGESPRTLAALHRRVAEWFAASDVVDAAITHYLAAGDAEGAATLIKRQVQPALAREDWPSVARWLALLPRDLVEAEPRLLLAQGWVLHFRGLGRQLVDVLGTLAKRLNDADTPADVVDSLRAEAMLMQYGSLVPFQVDPEGARAAVQGFAAQLTPSQVFAMGIAQTGIGMGLHATGRTREGVTYLEEVLERAPAPIDAAAVRPMIGLLWIHGQASHVGEAAAVAQAMLEITERNSLRLSAGWARRFLGDASYEQNDLDGAMAHYTAIVHDHDFFHLAGVREALFGLALVSVAQGRADDAWRALRRAREIMVGADALEHLALLEAYTAYLALATGDHSRALAWARGHAPDINSVPLFIGLHPTVVRAMIFIVAGDGGEAADAMGILEEVATRCAHGNYGATLARVNALLGVAHMKQGNSDLGVAAMGESLAGGAARGFTRTYLDLLPLFQPQLQALAVRGLFPPGIAAAIVDTAVPHEESREVGAVGLLTEREREVLAALFQRLSYKEIAENLYISPATVKRHASSIYSKLGVSGRTEAIRAARELGWQT